MITTVQPRRIVTKKTDHECGLQFLTPQGHSMSEDEIYKALVYRANCGETHFKERYLKSEFQKLLEIRRKMGLGLFEEARQLLENLLLKDLPLKKLTDAIGPLVRGDAMFLWAIVAKHLGDLDSAIHYSTKAAEIFAGGEESHRYHRSLINREIFRLDLQSFLSGNLYLLSQETSRIGFLDLVGNIHKGCSVELLNCGKLKESHISALQALGCYENQGAPDDRAITMCLLAITYFLAGERAQAEFYYRSCLIREGRVKPYILAYESLSRNQIPVLKSGDPLYGTPWNKLIFRSNSVTGRITNLLRQKPRTRDEIIIAVWGNTALHPSYCDRVHAAIKVLRKKGTAIHFDGTYYEIH